MNEVFPGLFLTHLKNQSISGGREGGRRERGRGKEEGEMEGGGREGGRREEGGGKERGKESGMKERRVEGEGQTYGREEGREQTKGKETIIEW